MTKLENTTWAKTNPSIIGWYWFYGWHGQYTPENKAVGLYPVQIVLQNDILVAVLNDQYGYNFRGFWHKAELPDVEVLNESD